MNLVPGQTAPDGHLSEGRDSVTPEFLMKPRHGARALLHGCSRLSGWKVIVLSLARASASPLLPTVNGV